MLLCILLVAVEPRAAAAPVVERGAACPAAKDADMRALEEADLPAPLEAATD